MDVWGAGYAVIQALVVAGTARWMLRHLPAPVDEPDSDPYTPLATVRFVVTACLATLVAASLVAALTRPVVWPAWFALNTAGVLLALIDSRTTFLPLRLTQAAWALAAVGVLATAALTGNPWLLLSAGGAAALWSGVFWLFWRFGRGFGFGDVRVAALAGATAGIVSFQVATWALLLASVAGVLLGVGSLLLRRGRAYPYGPALVLGPYLALLVAGALGLPVR